MNPPSGSGLSATILALLEPGTRAAAATELSARLGMEEIFLFLPDPQLRIPLPAPGFPQVLPDAEAWRLAASTASGSGVARNLSLPYPRLGMRRDATAVGIPDGTALILLGKYPGDAAVDQLRSWLPWISRVLRAENELKLAKAQERMAITAVNTAKRTSAALEGMRKTLEGALRQAELEQTKALREEGERRKFVALVENSAESIAMADLYGRIFYLNPAGCRMLGMDCPEDSATMTLQDFLSEDFRPAFRDIAMPAVKALGRWEGEVRFRFPKREGHLDVHQSLFLVKEPGSGKPLCIAHVARDLTERKKAEAILRATEAQLQQSQKMESVGMLAGGIAHDFNNLLTAINGYSDLSLPLVEAGTVLHANLGEIRKAGERAAALTRQLLAYSRKQILSSKVMGLNDAVAQLHSMLIRLIGEDIHLKLALGEGAGMVKADPGQLDQVVLNLVLNARDATPHGGTITLSTGETELSDADLIPHPGMAPGRYAVLTVSDTGVGMSPEIQSRIFEPFFTTKEFGKGSGMGLPMVQGIINQSGGFITVESAPGKGSAFRVHLPRVEQGRASVEGERRTPHKSLRGGETVLLAEDEESVRKLTRGILEAQGYRVLEAKDGNEGVLVSEAHGNGIALLLTDVIMPKMNGKQLAERIAIKRPGIKVIFMSGYTDEAIIRHGFIQAENHFLQKPFTPDMLLKTVRGVLDGTTSRPSAAIRG